MRWARTAATTVTFAVLVSRLRTGPFLDGLHCVDGGALAAAAGLAVLTTAWVYGATVFAASLPGAAVLVVDWVRRTPSAPWLEQPAGRVLRVPARPEAAPDA